MIAGSTTSYGSYRTIPDRSDLIGDLHVVGGIMTLKTGVVFRCKTVILYKILCIQLERDFQKC